MVDDKGPKLSTFKFRDSSGVWQNHDPRRAGASEHAACLPIPALRHLQRTASLNQPTIAAPGPQEKDRVNHARLNRYWHLKINQLHQHYKHKQSYGLWKCYECLG
ncbi:hypothetical protein ACFX15_011960 [Malus domestica]